MTVVLIHNQVYRQTSCWTSNRKNFREMTSRQKKSTAVFTAHNLLPTEYTQHEIQHKKRAQNDQTNKVDPRRPKADGVIHLQGPKQDG